MDDDATNDPFRARQTYTPFNKIHVDYKLRKLSQI